MIRLPKPSASAGRASTGCWQLANNGRAMDPKGQDTRAIQGSLGDRSMTSMAVYTALDSTMIETAPLNRSIQLHWRERGFPDAPLSQGIQSGSTGQHQPAGSSMPCSRIQRRRARATSARCCSAARRLFFLKVMSCRSKNRETALLLVRIRRLRSSARVSSKVRSDCSATRANICSPCRSSGETLPPRGFGAQRPVSFHRRIRVNTETFRRLPPRCSCFNCLDHAPAQISRIRLQHCPPPQRRNNATRIAHL